MKNTQEIKSLLEWRIMFLEVMKISLRLHKEYGDESFHEYAKWFGSKSLEFGKLIEKIT